MIDISLWLDDFLYKLNVTFKNRVWFAGLQGSYGRGEATAKSDIDIVLILDEVAAEDLKKYNLMLDSLPYRELVCGFVAGKAELLNWEPSDLFSLYYDTKALVGSLDELLALIDEESVNRSIKIGACNIYHGCVHNMLFDKSEDILRSLYKSATFIIKAIVFKQIGEFVSKVDDLLQVVSSEEQEILGIYKELKNGAEADFARMSEALFLWTKKWIKDI